eukprot:GHVN01003404.1.p1 GENE.GHVN01003404.1~~GHVN01003404.1.p1  ORF type:complete len:138 (-),score=33.86 GHVN01003404.1:371-784(-)
MLYIVKIFVSLNLTQIHYTSLTHSFISITSSQSFHFVDIKKRFVEHSQQMLHLTRSQTWALIQRRLRCLRSQEKHARDFLLPHLTHLTDLTHLVHLASIGSLDSFDFKANELPDPLFSSHIPTTPLTSGVYHTFINH